jgi:hypothetical protein
MKGRVYGIIFNCKFIHFNSIFYIAFVCVNFSCFGIFTSECFSYSVCSVLLLKVFSF